MKLPPHNQKTYPAASVCIYCGSTANLTKEHIVPLAAGGRWVFPSASCKACAAITGKFEGEVCRTILGPLRIQYELPTRRPKERPDYIELKVKYRPDSDWENIYVSKVICPILIILPLYPMPHLITGAAGNGDNDCKTGQLWIRGAGYNGDLEAHLQRICDLTGAVAIMPTGTAVTEPFCRTIAKVAHAYACAELGPGAFVPYLKNIIMKGDFFGFQTLIGGGQGIETHATGLHEVLFTASPQTDPLLIVVKVQLLGILGTPTYYVVVGRRV